MLYVPRCHANFGMLSLAFEKGWMVKITPHESPVPLPSVKKKIPLQKVQYPITKEGIFPYLLMLLGKLCKGGRQFYFWTNPSTRYTLSGSTFIRDWPNKDPHLLMKFKQNPPIYHYYYTLLQLEKAEQ